MMFSLIKFKNCVEYKNQFYLKKQKNKLGMVSASVPAGAVLVLKMRIKCSMVATPYPHYAAQLFHEQHLQNKFGIQIC